MNVDPQVDSKFNLKLIFIKFIMKIFVISIHLSIYLHTC